MYDEPVFLLYAFAKWYKPELVIQTGHLWGKSAMAVLAALGDGFLTSTAGMMEEEQDADKTLATFIATNRPSVPVRPKVISIDPLPKGVPDSDTGIRYLREYDANFDFYRMESDEFFRAHGNRLGYEFAGRRIMGIVDGDHTWEGCVNDLEALAAMGTEFIVVDDMTWLPHLKRAAREFARRNGYEFLTLPFFTGLGILWHEGITPASPKTNRFPYSLKELLYTLGGFPLISFLRRLKRIVLG